MCIATVSVARLSWAIVRRSRGGAFALAVACLTGALLLGLPVGGRDAELDGEGVWDDWEADDGPLESAAEFAVPSPAPAARRLGAALDAGVRILHVDVAATGLGDGTDWANAFTSLRTALTLAYPGDQVWVAAGIYTEGAQISLNASHNGIGVYGGFAGIETSLEERDWRANETILDGENAHRHLYASGVDRTLVLDGFTFLNGRAIGNGAGLYVRDSNGPRVRNCTFQNNVATGGKYSGGGACCYLAATWFENCRFFANSAADCGGAICWRDNNGAYGGPGLVSDCVFEGNTAPYGATAIIWRYSAANWVNCLFLPGSSAGGYIRVDNPLPSIFTNCTFANPTGLSLYLWRGSMANIACFNTVFMANLSAGANLSHCRTPAAYPGEGNLTANPLFANAGDPAGPDGFHGTADDGYRLDENSPCIDAGNLAACAQTDLAGTPRPVGLAPDMGAYEFVPDGPLDTDGDGMPDDWELANGLDPFDPADAALDPDGDGLTNFGEFLAGTLPGDPDTDGDGLFDGAEVLVHLTNPLLADTDGDGLGDGWEVIYGLDPNAWDNPLADPDGDGLTNLEEFQAGTNPSDWDTDGDRLPDGWEVANGLAAAVPAVPDAGGQIGLNVCTPAR